MHQAASSEKLVLFFFDILKLSQAQLVSFLSFTLAVLSPISLREQLCAVELPARARPQLSHSRYSAPPAPTEGH